MSGGWRQSEYPAPNDFGTMLSISSLYKDENAMPKSADKYYPTENVILDLRTSCTRDEAAAKLIGWMKGYIRHDYPSDIDEDEITSDHLVYTHSLIYGLQEHLQILRNTEWNRYIDAECAELPDEILAQKAYAIAECDELIRKVGEYLCDIDEELDKEYESPGASALKIDRRITEDSGTLHITIRSLDRWARQKYGISILDSDTPVSADSMLKKINVASEWKENQADEANSKGRPLTTALDHVYTTLAFTLEAYVATLPEKYRKDDGRMNVAAVAEHLEKLATNANLKPNLPDSHQRKLLGQDSESIRKRIPKSLNIMRNKLLEG